MVDNCHHRTGNVTPRHKPNRHPKEVEVMAKVSYQAMCGPDGLLAKREPFEGNSMKAEYARYRPYGGQLSQHDYERLCWAFKTAVNNGNLLYVVYSYTTPIAWAEEGRHAYIVDDKFSVTTSKQQTYVRGWINRYYPEDGTDASYEQYRAALGAYKAERERLAI